MSVIRNRKLRPLHPEEIHNQLRLSVKPVEEEKQRWLLTLQLSTGMRRFVDLRGTYLEVTKNRDELMQLADDVESSWLVLQTPATMYR